MKRPSRVKVGAHWYRIRWIPEQKVEGKYIGLCFPHSKTIKIARELPKRMLVQTLIHETMHAIYYEWGLIHSEMPAADFAAGLCSEENAVNTISQGLTTVFVDNPDFRRFVMECLR